jgi:hypothetical protein
MIHHVLLIKEHDGMSDEDRAELERAIGDLEEVESVLEMSWGRNFSERSLGFTYGAVIRFEDEDALARYQDDPDHQRIVQIFRRLTLERLILDYETGMRVSSAP